MGFHFALSTLAAALWFASALTVSRAVGERLATEHFAPLRWGVWLVVALGGTAALSRVTIPLPFALGAWLLCCWLLIGSAVEVRGSEARRKLSLVQLYLFGLGLCYAFLRSLGLITGASASAKYVFDVQTLASEFSLPLLSLLGARGAEGASAAVFWATHGLGAHLFAVIALSMFACAAFAAAYLAARPLSAPGVDLLPLPSVASLVFLLLALLAWLLPAGSVAATGASLASATLLPFFVAEGTFALHRLLRAVRVRLLLFAIVFAAGVLLPAAIVTLALLGVVAQVLRLRELLPFNRLADAPLGRPPLAASVGWFAGFAALALLGALLFQRSLRAHSSTLDARADLCGSLETSVSWPAQAVKFTGPNSNFSIDVAETALPAGLSDASSAERACKARGKRLCSVDEWYTACLCTYPGEAEAGLKLGTNYALAARAERERAAPEAGTESSTIGEGKQSEVRALLAKRSEVVQNPAGNGVLLAGPSELLSEPFTVDCRYRALLMPQALAESKAFVGLRCCSAGEPTVSAVTEPARQ